MPCGVPIGYGFRYLFDQHAKFWRAGLPVYLRIKNTTAPESGYTELGFQYAASGSASGFTDQKIDPPAIVTEVSMGNIGLNDARLMFGARSFKISHTFVLSEMTRRDLSDAYQVFRDPAVIGLFYNGRLFSIESLTHEDAGGQIIAWNVVGNAQETQVDVSGQ